MALPFIGKRKVCTQYEILVQQWRDMIVSYRLRLTFDNNAVKIRKYMCHSSVMTQRA